MLIRVHSVTTAGLKPIAVDVEVTTTSGIPQIFLIGMVNTVIREAKDRIITAIKVLGIKLKARKTIISLTPADVKKSGSSYDLAIAVSLLALYQRIKIPLETTAFIGEISLDGSIKAISQCFSLVTTAKNLGYKSIIIPYDNSDEVNMIDGIQIYGIKHLNEVLNTSIGDLKSIVIQPVSQPQHAEVVIAGQTEAVRALTIAIAGKHHILLVGPPGVGKSTLPKFAKSIQPILSKEQAIEVQSLYSLHNIEREHLLLPPFRVPHHSVTLKKVLGYESNLQPGEASLAHNGVLFLDELPQFTSSVLQTLKTLMDQKHILLLSFHQEIKLPADFILIAASNPCPCGFWQTGVKACQCSLSARNAYNKKITWPLRERFDLQVHLSPLQACDYGVGTSSYSSSTVRNQVSLARKRQGTRYLSPNFHNSNLTLETVNTHCKLTADTKQFLQKAVATYNLSTRGYEKIIAVAQTIADLENASTITTQHCAEALQYRPAPL